MKPLEEIMRINCDPKDKWGSRDSRTLEEKRKLPLNIKGYMSYGIMSGGVQVDPETGRAMGEPSETLWVFSDPGPLRREVHIVSPELIDAYYALMDAVNGAVKAFEENWTVDTETWKELLDVAEKLLPTTEEEPTDDKAA